MKNHYVSQIIFSEDSSQGKIKEKYQIEPFDIKENSLTHDKLNSMIDNWDSFGKIQEKFYVWEFSFGYEKILKVAPLQFYQSAIKYVFLKKLPMIIKDFDQNQVLKVSLRLKEIYKIQSLAGKLKGKRFDYLLLVAVKLIGFFFGSHTREIIINTDLQAQIYTILVYVLLGTQVGAKAFPTILQRYKQKSFLKFNGRSQAFKPTLVLSNHPSSPQELVLRQTLKMTKSKKRIGRTECRTGTALFYQLPEEDENIVEMKQTVKANLMVKEFVPKPKPKETLDQVLAKAQSADLKLKEIRQLRKLQKNQLRRQIFYTQMSNSLDLSRSNESLNTVHNHCITLKTQKRSKHYQLIPKQTLCKSVSSHQQTDLKLPHLQKSHHQYSYQSMLLKKKSSQYWKKVIGQMKESRFDNLERFPPISANMYFKQGEEEEEKKSVEISQTVDVNEKDLKDNKNIKDNKENYHAEFLTEKVIEPIKNLRQTQHTIPTMSKIPRRRAQPNQLKKASIIPVLQQLKNQINVTEYSSASNVKQIYKNQKAFINVYSSQSMDDLNTKLKKKSYFQLKDIQKKFQEECAQRKRKIQLTHFA